MKLRIVVPVAGFVASRKFFEDENSFLVQFSTLYGIALDEFEIASYPTKGSPNTYIGPLQRPACLLLFISLKWNSENHILWFEMVHMEQATIACAWVRYLQKFEMLNLRSAVRCKRRFSLIYHCFVGGISQKSMCRVFALPLCFENLTAESLLVKT